MSSLRLCDTLLCHLVDDKTANPATTAKMYWQLKYVELAPYIAERFGETVERLFKRILRARDYFVPFNSYCITAIPLNLVVHTLQGCSKRVFTLEIFCKGCTSKENVY